MALSSRELRIAWATVAIVVGAVLWQYGVSPLLDNYQQLLEVLEAEEKVFNENKAIMAQKSKIEENYRKIMAMFPKDDPEKDPAAAFSEDVDAAVRAILPGAPCQIEVVERAEIKDVPEYQFLKITVNTRGELEKIAQLLKGFDQKGFLIKNLTVRQTKGIDNPELSLNFTLARIVKVEEEEGGKRGRRKPRAEVRIAGRVAAA